MKKTNDNKKSNKLKEKVRNINRKQAMIIILLFGTLSIFATYAWFSVNLNVKIRTFKIEVTKNSGLTISFDGINFDTAIEISKEELIEKLVTTYPNNTTQWASLGLSPVSSNGITNRNSPIFNIYESNDGVRYRDKSKTNGFIYTSLVEEKERREYSRYIAFDVFFKNETDSPVSDNLYFDTGTEVTMEEGSTEEMLGLLNSVRLGIVKIGSVNLGSPVDRIQNISCHNDCNSIIYEPNSTAHTDLSIEKAKRYGINLTKGQKFPTYASIRGGGPIYVANTVSGSANLDNNYFALQNTMTEANLGTPLFKIPDGITKARIYLWVEGQDIDSLETDSTGADISVSINFVKDTAGYE